MSIVLSSSNNRLFAKVAWGKADGLATTGCATGSSERVYVITNARDAMDKIVRHCKPSSSSRAIFWSSKVV
jgi:hypothetical protein